MSHRLALAAGAAALAVWLAFAAPADAEPARAQVQTFKLGNGMQVVVIPDHRLPVVTHMVWYRVGAVDDPAGASGAAHFLEHLMFKSTTTRKAGEFARTITRIGGRDNAFTTHDATHYYQRVAREHLATVMQLEADRMVNLRLTEDEVRTERDVVREERRATVENNPLGVLSEKMLAALYPDHPYGRPAIGWSNEIETLSREHVAALYGRTYAAGNATLVVAGDVTLDTVRELAQSTYGRVPAATVSPERRRPAEPAVASAGRVALQDARAGTPALLRFYATPGLASTETGIAEALDLLAQIVGGDDASRLYRSLVARNVAATAGASYFGNGRDGGRLAFVVLPVGGVTLADAEGALDGVIAKVCDDGVDEKELARAKATLEARRIFEADDQLQLARRYGEGLSIGRTIEDIEASNARLAAVTAEDVRRAAVRFLDAKRSVTGTLMPETTASR